VGYSVDRDAAKARQDDRPDGLDLVAAVPDRLPEDAYRSAIAAWDAWDAALLAVMKDAEQEQPDEGVERSAGPEPVGLELVWRELRSKLRFLGHGKQDAGPSAARSCVAEAPAAEEELLV